MMPTAFNEYVRLAYKGDREAQYCLAEAWSKGEGVPWPDEGQALKWYKEAAKQGHTMAEYKYACCLYWGIGTEVTVNEREIDSMLYRAAHAGVPEAQFLIAHFKLNYWCQNSETSDYWYRRAAEQNHAFSQFCLGRSILQNASDCTGDEKNQAIAEGLEWLRKAALNGVYIAAYQLLSMYKLGLGGIEKDLAETEKWQAITTHNAKMHQQSRNEKRAYYSQFGYDNPYGQYLRGVSSFHSNPKEAMAWFKAAADQGNLGAKNFWNCVYSFASASYKPNIPSFDELEHDRDYFWCLLKRDNWDEEFFNDSVFVIEEYDIEKLLQR